MLFFICQDGMLINVNAIMTLPSSPEDKKGKKSKDVKIRMMDGSTLKILRNDFLRLRELMLTHERVLDS